VRSLRRTIARTGDVACALGVAFSVLAGLLTGCAGGGTTGAGGPPSAVGPALKGAARARVLDGGGGADAQKICVESRGVAAMIAATATERSGWSEFHRTNMERCNPFEKTLNVGNVGSLRLKWRRSTGGGYSAPAIVKGVVFLGSSRPYVYALNATTGTKLWSYKTGAFVASSPAAANGVVYVGSEDDNVYALNARTGTKLWSFATRQFVFSSPTVANGIVYIGSEDNYLYALNATTGAEIWSYNNNGPVDYSPAVEGGVVFGSEYALNAKTGALLWTSQSGCGMLPAVVQGVAYGGGFAEMCALDAHTGKTLWIRDLSGVRNSTSPALANGSVYFGADDGKVYALDAATGSILWTYATGDVVESSPAVANGVVYVGSFDGRTYALDAGTGTKLWSYYTGSISSSPVVVNGVLYVDSDDGSLYAFGLK
jgi:eukaryotic-like serine/threonine-protein kinase